MNAKADMAAEAQCWHSYGRLGDRPGVNSRLREKRVLVCGDMTETGILGQRQTGRAETERDRVGQRQRQRQTERKRRRLGQRQRVTFRSEREEKDLNSLPKAAAPIPDSRYSEGGPHGVALKMRCQGHRGDSGRGMSPKTHYCWHSQQ